MGNNENISKEVVPFDSPQDYGQMVDYFLNADERFLEGMGVDWRKLRRFEI